MCVATLADRLEFVLQIDGDAEALPPVSARVMDAPVAEALPVLLADVPHHADYVAGEGGGDHVLRSLRVGGSEPLETEEVVRRTLSREVQQQIRDAMIDRRLPEPDPSERYDEDDEEERDQREWIDRLSSRDPKLREEAAYEIEPEGRGLDALLDLVYNDPDPDVRVAAVSQLEDSDAHASVEGLIDALGDRDRRVVLEAIDALEFAGDESVIPSLEPLLDSSDPEIREAAEEAIEFLE